MPREAANRIGYVICCFIIVPLLAILTILNIPASKDYRPEDPEDDTIN